MNQLRKDVKRFLKDEKLLDGGLRMGEALLDEVTSATGLPEKLVADELTRLVKNAGLSKDAVTLDDLREMLADYLQDVMLELAEAQAQAEAQQASIAPLIGSK
ncbi:MAG TPA: hypothetical protein VM432_04915 [Bdellovibrionales bacterium]|jgi:hypothetical protein|nr:hypothetical protein [Bdellovibrionales bacterium]